MPPMFITGTAAAASIAWIHSLGNLGGFFGPWYVGVIKDCTGSYAGGLYGLVGVPLRRLRFSLRAVFGYSQSRGLANTACCVARRQLTASALRIGRRLRPILKNNPCGYSVPSRSKYRLVNASAIISFFS
jgi:hypothetical protein